MAKGLFQLQRCQKCHLQNLIFLVLCWVQVFPEDSRGQYVNKVDFGLVKADLLANYERPQKDRINVAFEWIKFMLGPLSFKMVRLTSA